MVKESSSADVLEWYEDGEMVRQCEESSRAEEKFCEG